MTQDRGFRVPPLLIVALLGFASGLPLYLTGSTLKAWFTESGINLKTIGMAGLITQPYALKFLWAPLLDRYVPPLMGRRRGWMLVFQGLLILFLVGLAFGDPSISVGRMVVLGFLVAFASASQDIVIDAWRAESFDEQHLGMANAVNIGAYRVAMLVSGALALIIADRVQWRTTYLFMALLMGVGVLGTLLAQSSDHRLRPPRTLKAAVLEPLTEFMRRRGVLEILAFCVLYKVGDQLAEAMTTPFLIRGMGFTLTEIGTTTKTVGIIFIILGGLLGGLVMRKLSLKRSLVLFGFCQAGSILAFWALSRLGPHLWALVGALALENLCYGMGGTAFATFLMRLCDKRFTATQYALLSSLFAVSRSYLSAPTGWLALQLGWSGYFLFCAAAAIPGLLLLRRFDHWGMPEDEAADTLPS